MFTGHSERPGGVHQGRKRANEVESSGYWFVDKFNTKLTANEEEKFIKWVETASLRNRRNIGDDLESYDLRGFWKNGNKEDVLSFALGGHAPDTWKKPNHPTFSKESIYSVGEYEGGDWLSETEFSPSVKMLKTTHPILKLHDYLRKHGEGVRLVLPKEKVNNSRGKS